MSNPTTLVESFDGDAGAFSVSGPERYNDGLWLEEGTTNWLLNPDFETNLSNWNFDGGVNPSRVTGEATSGTYALELDIATASDDRGMSTGGVVPANADGEPWTVSSYMRSDSVGASLLNFALELNSGGGFLRVGATDSQSIGATKQRFDMSFSTGASTALLELGWRRQGTNLETIYIDAMQAERKPYATSFAHSALGPGYSAGGGGEHIRAAGTASVDPAGLLSPGQGSLAFRFRRLIDTGGEELYFACGTVGSGTDALRGGVDSSDHPFVEWNANNAGWERLTATETVSVDTEFVYLADWDGTTVQLQIDGGTIHAGTRDTPEDNWGAGELILEAA